MSTQRLYSTFLNDVLILLSSSIINVGYEPCGGAIVPISHTERFQRPPLLAMTIPSLGSSDYRMDNAFVWSSVADSSE